MSTFNDSSVGYGGGQARPGVVLALILALGVLATDGLTKQVQTVEFTSSGAASYAFTVTKPDGSTEVRTFTATAAESSSALTAAAFEAWLERTYLSTIYSASTSSATVTLTTRTAGESWTLSQPSNTTVTETVAAAGASDLYIGRAVIRSGAGAARSQNAVRAKHPRASDCTAQAAIATFSSVAAGDTAIINGVFRGVPFTASAEFRTDNNTTASDLNALLETQFNALYGAGHGLVATVSSGAITVTAENAGDEFRLTANVVGAGGGTVAVTGVPNPTTATSLRRKLLGVLSRDGAVKWDETTNSEIMPAGLSGSACAKGEVYVASAQSISMGDEVYVGTSSTETGKLYNAAAAGRVWLDRASASWRADESAGGLVPAQGLAILSLNL